MDEDSLKKKEQLEKQTSKTYWMDEGLQLEIHGFNRDKTGAEVKVVFKVCKITGGEVLVELKIVARDEDTVGNITFGETKMGQRIKE